MKKIRIRVERVYEVPLWLRIVIPIIAILVALSIIAIIFLIQGINPIIAYAEIFHDAFLTTYGIKFNVVKLIPLLLCSLGLSVAFKANVWNIGAEGQLLMGAIAATWIALFKLKGYPSYIVIPAMYVLGFIFGALWALIPALLKAKFEVNEIITTLMMNYIAMKLVLFLIYGPWRGTTTWKYPITDEFPAEAQLPLIPGTLIHWPSLLIALILVPVIYLFLKRTKIGYEISVFGLNPNAARYAGINKTKVLVIVMLISGGLAGIAGVGEVAGIHHRLRYPSSISSGYGYTAIITTWLAKLNPLLLLPTTFFFGGLLVGGDVIKIDLRLPSSVVYLFNGLILTSLVSSDILLRYRIRLLVVGEEDDKCHS
ncbi:MAG: ABC transporter permease [Thermoprotei archaeon]|nr:MAG: ABC transporter permease [Thermoprotei archaeon]